MAQQQKVKIINDEVVQLRPSELAPFIRLCFESVGPTGQPLVPFIMGGIGIGKSSIVRQVVGEERNSDPNYGYIEYRTATQEPTDVTGVPMPNPTDKTTEFYKPARLANLPKDWRGVVFLDEFTKAPPSVTNAWSQPILDRHIDDMELPAGLRFVVAGNRRQDKSSDTALGMFMYNRLVQVELVPDVMDTVAHFKSIGVRDDICAFLKFGGEDHLYTYNPDKTVHATPRSWEMAARAVTTGEKMGAPEPLIAAVVTGAVGKAPAYAYMQFRNMMNKLPSVSEVIANPTGAPVFTEASTAYAMALCLARRADASNIVAMMTYLERNDIEIQAAFIADAGKRNPAIKETRSYIDWAVKHKDVSLS